MLCTDFFFDFLLDLGMHCARAQESGYTPVFCTLAEGDGDCPTLSCYRYADQVSFAMLVGLFWVIARRCLAIDMLTRVRV